MWKKRKVNEEARRGHIPRASAPAALVSCLGWTLGLPHEGGVTPYPQQLRKAEVRFHLGPDGLQSPPRAEVVKASSKRLHHRQKAQRLNSAAYISAFTYIKNYSNQICNRQSLFWLAKSHLMIIITYRA